MIDNNTLAQLGITPEQFEKLKSLLPAQPKAVSNSIVGTLVTYKGFTCYISKKVTSLPEAILREAFGSDTAWYLTDASGYIGDVEQKEITHDEYCDWLRRGA